MNIIEIYKKNATERDHYVEEAQLISELTIPSICPRASQGNSNYNYGNNEANNPRKLRRPKSSAPARGVNSLSATLTSTLNPPNIQFFRFIYDPTLTLSQESQDMVNDIYHGYEKKVESFLAKFNFFAFSNSLTKRCLIEGNVGCKVDVERGFMLYPLRCIQIKRSFGTKYYAIFEESILKPDPDDKNVMRPYRQYIYVDYKKNEVLTQQEDQEQAKKTDELASQYIVAVTELPVDESYGRSFYIDYYGLLKSIDQAATALEEAQLNCSWNWISFSGPSNIPTDRIAKIKNRQVVRLPNHEMVHWQGTGQKISDWQFVNQMLIEKEQAIQYISAAGLVAKAGSMQTAYEVSQVRQELDSLVGSVAQVLAEEYYKAVVEAVVEVLGIRQELQDALMAANINVTQEQLKKLIQPIVISGVPAMAREQEAQKMLQGAQSIMATFGPVATPIFDIQEFAKEYFDGLKVNTKFIRTKEDVQAMMQQAQQGQPTNTPMMNGGPTS